VLTAVQQAGMNRKVQKAQMGMDKPQCTQANTWTMFTTSKEEIREMLVDRGEFTIESGSINVNNYPFKPSIISQKQKIVANDIINIDIKATPPTIRIGDELIFIPINMKKQLLEFASLNQIPIVERSDIWDWLLEPFLDTEYSDQTHQRLNALLATYGLTEDRVAAIRSEVKIQMLKYNFDTMLWDWVHLGAVDVLCAMRPKYDSEEYKDFYRRVMDIALLPDK
jgi:hypothetical protein